MPDWLIILITLAILALAFYLCSKVASYFFPGYEDPSADPTLVALRKLFFGR